MNKKIVLFGSTGRLGKEMSSLGDFLTPSRLEVDISNFKEIRNYLDNFSVSEILHSAALVGARECEQNRELAYSTNVIGTKNLAKICSDKGLKLIYISTDTIFNGEKGDYKEEDIPNPLNYYSFTKFVGECFVQTVPSHLIIRTSFIPHIFPYEKAFVDQYTSRIPIGLLAKEILMAIEKDVEGVIHIGRKKDSLYDVIKEIKPTIRKLTRAETGLKLPRDLSLDSSKWEAIKNES